MKTKDVFDSDSSPFTGLTVEITVAAHDTTGGMVTKISEAAAIAKLGIDVFIVKVILHFPHTRIQEEQYCEGIVVTAICEGIVDCNIVCHRALCYEPPTPPATLN